MKSLWSRIAARNVSSKAHPHRRPTPYEMAKGFKTLQSSFRSGVKDIVFIISGIVSAGFGLKGFLLPNNFIDGGTTGISLIVSELSNFSFPIILVLINIPFVLLAWKVIDRPFAIKVGFSILGLSLCTAFIPFPEVTHDKLLVAVFGGFFLGAGIGLSIRGGAVLDGTEVLAIFISRKNSLSIGDVILIFNVFIFLAAAWLLSVEIALYAVLTYLVASKTVDFIIEGIEEYTGVTIISVKNEEIRQMISKELGRGVTVYRGKRGFGTHGDTYDIDIVFTVITRLEVSRLYAGIDRIDPNAFVVMHSIRDTKGGMIKKRPLH